MFTVPTFLVSTAFLMSNVNFVCFLLLFHWWWIVFNDFSCSFSSCWFSFTGKVCECKFSSFSENNLLHSVKMCYNLKFLDNFRSIGCRFKELQEVILKVITTHNSFAMMFKQYLHKVDNDMTTMH